MPSLKLSNPFRRGADRPSLKQRAASLRATASRVIKGKRHDATVDPFDDADRIPGFVPYPFDKPRCFANIAHAVIPAEACRLLDLALAEYARRCALIEKDLSQKDRQARIQVIREALRIDALAAATDAGAGAGMPVERSNADFDSSLRTSGVVGTGGVVTYADAAGQVHRRPVDEWVAFMASRINSIARAEFARQFDAEAGTDADANAKLEAKLRKRLRLDALHALAFQSDRVFEAAKDCVIGHVRQTPGTALENLRASLPACSMEQLRNLSEVASHIQDVCHAFGFQPRCLTEEGRLKPAGELVDAVADLLGDLIEAIRVEAWGRSPETERDALTRLAFLAATVIDNGDACDTAAFICDLQAQI